MYLLLRHESSNHVRNQNDYRRGEPFARKRPGFHFIDLRSERLRRVDAVRHRRVAGVRKSSSFKEPLTCLDSTSSEDPLPMVRRLEILAYHRIGHRS